MHVRMELDGEEHDLWIVREGDVVKIEIDGESVEAKLGQSGTVTIGSESFDVRLDGDTLLVAGQPVPYRIHEFRPGGAPGDHRAGGARGARVKPPMPGKIVSIAVNEGDEIEQGQVLLILEAMKMQNEITAPAGGVVKKVHVKAGQNVEGKDLLVEIE
jgi:biotin carboxyl carrier protein